MIKIAPSILSADFSKMGEEVKKLQECGADYIHCDVMDGAFVSQITFGAKMVKAIREYTSLPLDVHLMINNPMKHIDDFINAGSDIITVHYEAILQNKIEVINYIRKSGAKCGISVKPNTDISEIKDIIKYLDLVLIMSVEPGKGGQKFLECALEKIKYCSDWAKKHNKDLLIEVDGGINNETAKLCCTNGATMLVAGSYIFKSNDKKKTIMELKQL